jgi:osmotically-inducible protein OsmY
MQRIILLALILLCSLSWVSAQQDNQTPTSPDNTRINKRDRSPNEATADQQKENMSDRDLTRAIRRALVEDKALSSKAHNVKVIAQNGTVTLKGPVASDQEKQAVEAKASQIAGPDKVTSELQVAQTR